MVYIEGLLSLCHGIFLALGLALSDVACTPALWEQWFDIESLIYDFLETHREVYHTLMDILHVTGVQVPIKSKAIMMSAYRDACCEALGRYRDLLPKQEFRLLSRAQSGCDDALRYGKSEPLSRLRERLHIRKKSYDDRYIRVALLRLEQWDE